MLTEPLIQQLHTLRLKGMASALEQQHASPDLTDRSFEDHLRLMISRSSWNVPDIDWRSACVG